MPSQKIIIDTDPGQDDAIAILLALASEEVDLLGIVTVAGNVPLELTSRNALMLCELAKKPETKVFAGCSRPLVRPLVTAEHVHGKTGLDGADLPEPRISLQTQHGVDWTIENLLAAGVVLTGGTSKMEGVIELAEEIFHAPVRLGTPHSVTGLSDIVENPIYSTGVGLLQYGVKQQQEEDPVVNRDTQNQIVGKMKNWFQGHF